MNNTAEQESAVSAALRGLVSRDSTAAVEEPVAAGSGTPIAEDQVIAAEAEATEAAADEPAAVEAVPSDDVTSLQQRLAERDAEVARYEERLAAVNSRNRQSLDALNQRSLKMATQRDRARQVLEKALSAEGVDKAEAERLLAEIRSGYNPGSANYAPPPEPEVPADNDQQVDGNQWLNDHGMTEADSQSLGNFIRSAQLSQREQRLAAQDIYSFLTVIKPRWQESLNGQPKTDAAKAVATVARVQKQAAKAASASLGGTANTVGNSPSRQKSAALSDEQVGALIKQVWEDR